MQLKIIEPSQNEFAGIVYLRAVLSCLIVVWHMGLIARSDIFSFENYETHTVNISDVINFQILLLAVPTFIVISCFLYISKVRTFFYFRVKLRWLITNLILWSALFNLHWYIHTGNIRLDFGDISSAIVTLLRGGNTPYYFFICLSICLGIAHLIQYLSSKVVLYLLFSIWLILCLFPFIANNTGINLITAFWNPINFISLPFAALLIHRYRQKVSSNRIYIVILFLLYVLLSALEWHILPSDGNFVGNGGAIPAYTRPSLVLGSVALLCIAIEFKPKPNKLIELMSNYSFGLYCVHPILIWPYNYTNFISFSNFSEAMGLKFLIILLLSYAIVKLLKSFFPILLNFTLKNR